jgi:hypothetical protein
VSGGGGGNAQNSGTGGAGGNFNNWKDKRANKNGGDGPNQVPVCPAQPNGGGSGQAAQKTAVTAAGTANGGGNANQTANHQSVQKNQQNQQNGHRQNYANYNRNNGGGGGSGANDDKDGPSACKVEYCARKEKHYLDQCDIFPTLPMVKRWTFIRENNICTYCLRHSSKLVCFKAANEKGPFPCGIEGCAEVHHPWLHCYSSVKGHVGLRVITMDQEKPHKEPLSKKQVERENVAAGAGAVNEIVREPAGSDSDGGDRYNFDADSKCESEVEMSAEPVEPQVEHENSLTEPTEPQEELEELEPQFSPVESSSHSDSYDSDTTTTTSASSGTDSDSGNESYNSINHFDSDEEEVNPANDYRKISLLQQTINIGGHDVNILYDDGASVSSMTVNVTAPSLLKAVNSCEIIAVEGKLAP